MGDVTDYWGRLPNILEDLKALSKRNKSENCTTSKEQKTGSFISALSVRNSVCIAGNNREAVLTLKQEVYKLISGRCTLESFHFQCDDDIKDGALFVPRVILVAVFQPGRKLIDESGDNGQLDQVYDEIYQVGAEMMLVYMGLPRLVYPINTQNLYHVRLEQLVFPEQKVVKDLADHGLLMTLTENSRKLNHSQERRMLEWLLRPVDPKTHPVFRTCALLNNLQQTKEIRKFHRSRNGFYSVFKRSYQNYNPEERFPNFSGFNQMRGERCEDFGDDTQMRQAPARFGSSEDDEDVNYYKINDHGFMKSLESYPLLKRNSICKNEKGSNVVQIKNNYEVLKDARFYKYGSIMSNDVL